MLFPNQIAVRVIVRGPSGEIQITTVNGVPRIEFRTNPASVNPNAAISYDFPGPGELTIETDYVRSGYGSQAVTQPAWYVRVQGAGRGLLLDDNDDFLKTFDGNILANTPEPVRTITTFANGWTAGVPVPQCYRDPTGRVFLRGRLVPGVTANGTVMCTLPSTHLPTQTVFVPCNQDQAPYNQPAVEIRTNGDVAIWSWTAGNMVLDSVGFLLF